LQLKITRAINVTLNIILQVRTAKSNNRDQQKKKKKINEKKATKKKFNLQWDSKITTLPGMYVSSILVLAPGILTKGASVCTTWILRYFNLLFNAASLIVAIHIFGALNAKEKDSKVRDKDCCK